MKKPKLSSGLSEELKKQSKNDRKRRIIANISIVFVIAIFIILAKVYVFKGDIKINGEDTKTPNEKIENQPATQDDNKTNPATQPAPAAATPAPAAPQPASDKGYITYVIKEGDTLSGVANANGMTSKQLMDYNGIVDPTSIMPGQSIKIPKQ